MRKKMEKEDRERVQVVVRVYRGISNRPSMRLCRNKSTRRGTKEQIKGKKVNNNKKERKFVISKSRKIDLGMITTTATTTM